MRRRKALLVFLFTLLLAHEKKIYINRAPRLSIFLFVDRCSCDRFFSLFPEERIRRCLKLGIECHFCFFFEKAIFILFECHEHVPIRTDTHDLLVPPCGRRRHDSRSQLCDILLSMRVCVSSLFALSCLSVRFLLSELTDGLMHAVTFPSY